jgi:hypothetical protein
MPDPPRYRYQRYTTDLSRVRALWAEYVQEGIDNPHHTDYVRVSRFNSWLREQGHRERVLLPTWRMALQPEIPDEPEPDSACHVRRL